MSERWRGGSDDNLTLVVGVDVDFVLISSIRSTTHQTPRCRAKQPLPLLISSTAYAHTQLTQQPPSSIPKPEH